LLAALARFRNARSIERTDTPTLDWDVRASTCDSSADSEQRNQDCVGEAGQKKEAQRQLERKAIANPMHANEVQK